MRTSRGARLGSPDSALEVARDQVWTGSSGRAVAVRLRWTRGRFTLTFPAAAEVPASGRVVVRPMSAFSWVVEGRVQRGPRQVIGVLDYRTGQVVWDVRRARSPR
ncbi:MAG: hypothetical protein U0Y82_03875 [Thermoleophilia bacterium]